MPRASKMEKINAMMTIKEEKNKHTHLGKQNKVSWTEIERKKRREHFKCTWTHLKIYLQWNTDNWITLGI